jgi:hypothetical protein
VIGEAAENAFLAKHGAANAWIGLRQASGDAPFAWVDGAKLDYAAWNDGVPSDSGGVEHCAELLGGDRAGRWNDADCGTKLAFVCEDAVTRAPADPADACDDCPTWLDPAQHGADGGACPALPGPP